MSIKNILDKSIDNTFYINKLNLRKYKIFGLEIANKNKTMKVLCSVNKSTKYKTILTYYGNDILLNNKPINLINKVYNTNKITIDSQYYKLKTNNTFYIQNAIKEYSKEKVYVYIKLNLLKRMLRIPYTINTNNQNYQLCKIVENKYQLKNNYKIELQSILNDHLSKKIFYIADLNTIIQSGYAEIFIKNNTYY